MVVLAKHQPGLTVPETRSLFEPVEILFNW
jgi:hypothetical protein